MSVWVQNKMCLKGKVISVYAEINAFFLTNGYIYGTVCNNKDVYFTHD